jgi:hypothetical protein
MHLPPIQINTPSPPASIVIHPTTTTTEVEELDMRKNIDDDFSHQSSYDLLESQQQQHSNNPAPHKCPHLSSMQIQQPQYFKFSIPMTTSTSAICNKLSPTHMTNPAYHYTPQLNVLLITNKSHPHPTLLDQEQAQIDITGTTNTTNSLSHVTSCSPQSFPQVTSSPLLIHTTDAIAKVPIP